MDRTDTYIKMSDCPGIQDAAPEAVSDNGRFRFHQYGDNLWVRVDGEPNSDGFYGEHRLIWLPHQGQLQEMSGLTWPAFDRRCERMASVVHRGQPVPMEPLPSKEVAGIWAVMFDKYGKVWSGERWESE